MIVTIHQPDFLPWLGFFHRWAMSEKYIVLDDVQFIRRGWHHRDKIKTPGGVKWLTVPVKKKGKFDQLIKDVRLEDGEGWRRMHLNTLRACYGKAPGFEEHFTFIETIYMLNDRFLIDFNMKLLEYAAQALGIETEMVLASEFSIEQTATARLVELVKSVGGTHYLTGTGSRDYLEENIFEQESISVDWQQFTHPTYPQLHGGFEPGMSIVDYLMMGQSGDVFKGGGHA